MDGMASVLAMEVGKHLGDVQAALPLRSVCKDWADTVTMNSESARLDLHPEGGDDTNTAIIKSKLNVFKLCPNIKHLTYYVSPRVTSHQFESCIVELNRKLPFLESLVLIFNNPKQQLQQCHLGALSKLSNLRSLAVQANMSPTNVTFAPLADLEYLAELRLIQTEYSTGLTDAHVESLSELYSLEVLEFPGHASSFKGATLRALHELDSLRVLRITWPRGCTNTYTLAAEARPTLQALLRSAAEAGHPLELELAVPNADWIPFLLGSDASSSQDQQQQQASSADGSSGQQEPASAGRLSVHVREPATSEQIERLASLPAKGRLVRLDLELSRALTAADAAAIGQLSELQSLQLTSKAVCGASELLDLASWQGLAQLTSFHLHINPAWRKPLTRATLAALAAAWPHLTHLHMRLNAADLTDRALDQLARFTSLKHLSLQWLHTAICHPSQPLPALNLCKLPASLAALHLSSISAIRVVAEPPAAAVSERAAAAAHVPQLSELVLDGNVGVSDFLLAQLAQLFPRLAQLALVLVGRQSLTPAGFAAAVARMGALRSLSVRDLRDPACCPVLGQECVAALAPLAQRLRSLRLSTPDLLRRELQAACFAGFKRLRELELAGCQEAAEAALGAELPLCCLKPTAAWAGQPRMVEVEA